MAKAKNAVIGGDFVGLEVKTGPQGVYLTGISAEGVYHFRIFLNRDTVERYELVSGTQSPSFTSAIGRGLIGAALFGTVGMVAGAATAKDNGIYRVAVYFRSDDPKSVSCGKRALLELDEKLYTKLTAACF